MSKRRNENGQMRREEWEAEDERDYGDSGGEAFSTDGAFQRATEDAISRRKIVTARVKRPAAGAPSSTPVAAPPAAPASKANPFAGFSGLVAAAPAPAATKANPFAGFSGLTSGSAQPSATAAAAATTSNTPTTYQQAIEGLNTEFLAFVSAQLKKNPSSDWTAAVSDYLKHAQQIGTKFASTKPVAGISSASASASLNVTPVRAAIPSFLNAATKKKDSVATSAPAPKAATTASPSTTVSSGFSFGAQKKEDEAPPTSTMSSGFSFGAVPAAAKSTVTSGFAFSSSPSTNATSATTAEASKPAFSFGAAPSTATSKPSGFSFGAAAATPAPATTTTAPTSGFSFSLAKPTAAPSSSSTSSSGFSFALPAASASATATPAAAAPATGSTGVAAGAAGGEEDEENIGREEATVILKSDNPDEDCVFEADKAKVLEFKKDEKRWADKGTHPLKVLVNKNTKNARILVRNEIGKIVLNSSLYKGLAVKPHEAKGKAVGALLALQVDASITQFILKVNGEKVQAFLTALEKATPQ